VKQINRLNVNAQTLLSF
jgi:hypothetical protein